MSIVFIGTPAFAVPSLRALVEGGFNMSAVLTQPDRPAGRGRKPRASPVAEVATELGLDLMKPESLRDPNAVSALAGLQPEAIVTVAYGQILRPEVLAIPPKGVLNVHPSLLPRWRGPTPVPAAILAGDRITGVTIMLMDQGMDTGPILSQTEHPIDDEDTAGSLLEALSQTGARLLGETLRDWLDGAIEPRPQDDSAATTCSLIRKQDGEIDWSLHVVDIWRRVRAFNPWPGAFTTFGGEMFHIWRAWPVPSRKADPGLVIGLDRDVLDGLPLHARDAGFAVGTGEGLLAVRDAQRAGRRALPAPELARGMPDIIGARLGEGE